jgi:hypothetical protein
MFAIDRSKINGKKFLIYDDGKVSFVDVIPKGCFIFGSDCCRSLQNLAALFHSEIPELIPENFLKMVSTLGAKNPNWIRILGKDRFFSNLAIIQGVYEKLRESIDPTVIKNQVKIECLIRMMNPAPYDPGKLAPEAFKRFEKFLSPHFSHDRLSAPGYIRTKTKTGRLTVVSGPPVLTMHADLRKGLIDAIQIDFRSMEPNLLLAYQGRETFLDLYSALAEEVFGGKLSRTKVKLSVIASLYNSDRRSKHAKAIADFFRVDEIIDELEGRVKDGFLINMYDRPIPVTDATKNHLLSLWLQSSAVDAALTGFCNLLLANKLAKPYWIIHDALIINNVDINVDHLDVGRGFRLPIKVGSFDE